jgi:hypothetical protein
VTRGQFGGGRRSDTTTSRVMLTFSPSIFTIIRSVAGWRAVRKIGRGRAPPTGPARRPSSSQWTGPFRWIGHELNHRLARRRAGPCTACSKLWHTLSGPQPNRGTRAIDELWDFERLYDEVMGAEENRVAA